MAAAISLPDGVEIRPSTDSDREPICDLYRDAFPDEDLLPLLRSLETIGDAVTSLVAVTKRGVIGHIVLSRCTVTGSPVAVSLLGPLAVMPKHQRQGIGSALLRAGLDSVGQTGTATVMVLGDPNYYRRFGFTTEHGLMPPYPLSDDYLSAWQLLQLAEDTPKPSGKLVPPEPWMQPALWADNQ